MTRPVISLITYSDLPDLDPDDHLLKDALERRGCQVQALVWDDDTIDWSKAGVCVLRSTWDYHKKFARFCAWLKYVSGLTTVMNQPELVLWNCRKTYLADLKAAGLPVIETRFVSNDSRPLLGDLLADAGWIEAIIKPTIGLATSGVKKIDLRTDNLQVAEDHMDFLLQASEVMVQEYLPSVHDYGERSLIFIDGNFSHCVRKSAFQKLAMAGHAGETAALATPEELEVAERILAFLQLKPLYARVDLVRDKTNTPLLIELELVEPSLFLKTCPSAAEPFVEAILRRTGVLSTP